MFEKEHISLDVIGVVLCLIGAFAIGYNIYLENMGTIWWFCYLGLIIMGFGILAENGNIILSQLNLLTLPALVWTVDFVYMMVSGHSILGITSYFRGEGLILQIISLQHLFTIPLGFYALSQIKVDKTGIWKFSFLQAVVIYGITRLFTSQLENVNYAFSAFFNFNFGMFYPLVWIAVAFVAIFVTNFFIIRFAEFNQ